MVETRLLRLSDARALAPLLADYAQALHRGAPRRPDAYYAERLLQDRTGEVLGVFEDKDLVGFALFYDLPEPVSGNRVGLCDHVHVRSDRQRNGFGSALIDGLKARAAERGWLRLSLQAPKERSDGQALFAKAGDPADIHAHVTRFAE